MNKELTDEELAAIARSELTVDESAKLNDIEQFILSFNLRTAEKLVPGMNIYWKYYNWSLENKQTPVTRKQFFKLFATRFRKVLWTREVRYAVGPAELFELSTLEWLKMRRQFRVEKNRSKRKKEKKRSKKSKSEETV